MLRIVGLLRIHPLILVLLVLFTAVFKKDKNYKIQGRTPQVTKKWVYNKIFGTYALNIIIISFDWTVCTAALGLKLQSMQDVSERRNSSFMGLGYLPIDENNQTHCFNPVF